MGMFIEGYTIVIVINCQLYLNADVSSVLKQVKRSFTKIVLTCFIRQISSDFSTVKVLRYTVTVYVQVNAHLIH